MGARQYDVLSRLGLDQAAEIPGAWAGKWLGGGAPIASEDPATGRPIASVRAATAAEYDEVVERARATFLDWRETPAPERGELVRLIGVALRQRKKDLGELVALESGKILTEGEGEVQEMIDIADFAVGLSRRIGGRTLESERRRHRMYEQWLPLGPVGIITAFNFPVAVWSWNALIAAVCGDTCIWKPSEKTPLCALAVQRIVNDVCSEMGAPPVFFLACGDAEIGRAIAADVRVPLVSATGSCRMGKQLAPVVAERLGRSLLELGGNNAAIVLDDADPDLAVRAMAFAAAGTAGQRCTTLRRAIVQEGIAPEIIRRLKAAYASLDERIGDPRDPQTLVGPLIDADALERFENAMRRVADEGGEVLAGGKRVDPSRLPEALRGGHFVEPTLVRARPEMPIVREETFAPILYLMTVSSLDEAIRVQNDVSQGLSSSMFTRSIGAAEGFLGAAGSDCGIANVNIGTSGAEIGGAFGGEKETGGGREAGSDSWKAYMRRQTCTINWGGELPLAQGVEFDV